MIDTPSLIKLLATNLVPTSNGHAALAPEFDYEELTAALLLALDPTLTQETALNLAASAYFLPHLDNNYTATRKRATIRKAVAQRIKQVLGQSRTMEERTADLETRTSKLKALLT